MPYTDTVGEEWGNPHPYGSTIWDVFVPNPRAEQRTQGDIYGAGYMGADLTTGIQENRSAFGRLMQGIGLIGEPDKRPMTYYEQYLYEQGKHAKSSIDYKTEKERLGLLTDALSTVDAEIKRGEQPSEMEDLMKYLPSGMRPGLERQATDVSSEKAYTDTKRQAELEYLYSQTNAANARANAEKKDTTAREHDLRLGSLYRMPMVEHWSKVYNALLDTAGKQTGVERDNTLAQADQAHKLLQAALQAAGADQSETYQIAGKPPVDLFFQGYGGPRDPNTDSRIINSAEGADKFFNMNQYPPEFPPSTPGPTPTPNMSLYHGMGGQ